MKNVITVQTFFTASALHTMFFSPLKKFQA